jgi:hypothetical protein
MQGFMYFGGGGLHVQLKLWSSHFWARIYNRWDLTLDTESTSLLLGQQLKTSLSSSLSISRFKSSSSGTSNREFWESGTFLDKVSKVPDFPRLPRSHCWELALRVSCITQSCNLLANIVTFFFCKKSETI